MLMTIKTCTYLDHGRELLSLCIKGHDAVAVHIEQEILKERVIILNTLTGEDLTHSLVQRLVFGVGQLGFVR